MKVRSVLLVLAVSLVALGAWLALAPSRAASPAPIVDRADSFPVEASEPSDAEHLIDVSERAAGLRETGASPVTLGPELSPGDPNDLSAAPPEPALPEVPSGTAIIGRLLDAGEPVRQARLQLTHEDKTLAEYLEADALGHFATAVELSGDVILVASADGRGRSTDLPLFLPKGRATDVGDLRLLGSGTIRGHVQSPDGAPFPGLFVRAKATDPLAQPGLRTAQNKASDDGSFHLEALAPGSFDFEVSMDESYPIVGARTFQAGEADAALIVDAALLRITCVNDAGKTVPMRALELSNVVERDPSEDDDGIGSTSRGWAEGVETFELYVRPGRSYMVQAHDAQMSWYFAYLQGDLTAGVHPLQLRQNPPNLGALKMSVPPGSLPDGSTLTLGRIQRNGQDVQGTILVGKGAPGAASVEMRGLVPGTYEVVAIIQDSPWIALDNATHHFELEAGKTEHIELTTREGGRIDLALQQESAELDGTTRATVQLRIAGTQEWSRAQLTSRRGNGTTNGPKAWIDGTSARSTVLAPGTYLLRVEAEGYLPAETDVIVRAKATSPVEITLLKE